MGNESRKKKKTILGFNGVFRGKVTHSCPIVTVLYIFCHILVDSEYYIYFTCTSTIEANELYFVVFFEFTLIFLPKILLRFIIKNCLKFLMYMYD